jgi:hypothetical protein
VIVKSFWDNTPTSLRIIGVLAIDFDTSVLFRNKKGHSSILIIAHTKRYKNQRCFQYRPNGVDDRKIIIGINPCACEICAKNHSRCIHDREYCTSSSRISRNLCFAIWLRVLYIGLKLICLTLMTMMTDGNFCLLIFLFFK